MNSLPAVDYSVKIGIGTVQFGVTYGISNVSGQTSPEEVVKILETAQRYKIDLIDTASAYGKAEVVLGQNKLDKFNIVSKYMPPTATDSVSQQLVSSLNKLNVKRLYGYLAHRPLNILDEPKQWATLLNLKEDGLIKKIGFSLNEPGELERLLQRGFYPDLIQVPYNYFDQRFESYLIDLKRSGCEIHTRSAFLQGLFFTKPEHLPGYFDEIKDVIESVQNSVRYLPASLLKYVLEKPFIDKVIIGVNNSEHFKNNIETLNLAENLPVLKYNLANKFLMPSNWPKSI